MRVFEHQFSLYIIEPLAVDNRLVTFENLFPNSNSIPLKDEFVAGVIWRFCSDWIFDISSSTVFTTLFFGYLWRFYNI